MLVIGRMHKFYCTEKDWRRFCASLYFPTPFGLPLVFNSLLHIFNRMRMTTQRAIFLRSHPFFQAIRMENMITQCNPDFAFTTQREIIQTHSTRITFASKLFHFFSKRLNWKIHIQFMNPNTFWYRFIKRRYWLILIICDLHRTICVANFWEKRKNK